LQLQRDRGGVGRVRYHRCSISLGRLQATRRHTGVVIPSSNVACCEKVMNGARKGTEEPVKPIVVDP
jgi:hypothetical protein